MAQTRTAQAGLGTQRVPRWRLLQRPAGVRPERAALQLSHRLREPELDLPLWGTPRYSAVASAPHALHIFVAASELPVGTALARLHEAAPRDMAWQNTVDRVLLSRGYDAGMLYLVKQAAVQAISGKPARLSSLSITPLPHRPGELLVRSSSGWTGRARAWHQAGYLLALAWEG